MDRELHDTWHAVCDLVDRATALERGHADALAATGAEVRDDARNLLHYLALRQQDLRELQRRLHALGLSSLAHAESHVLPALQAVRDHLGRMCGEIGPGTPRPRPDAMLEGPARLRDNARRLLGPAPQGRSTRIMVTMPSEAADDPALVAGLLAAGMDVMRINCAHDDADTWRRMAGHLRQAERETGRRCRIQVDLAGPKSRTGALMPAGRFASFRIGRDPVGRPLRPARVRLVPVEAGRDPGPLPEDALPVDAVLLAQVRVRDRLRVRDVRGRRIELEVVATDGGACVAEAARTLRVLEGAACERVRDGRTLARGAVRGLAPVVRPLRLRPGDALRLTRGDAPGREARIGDDGRVLEPARIPCTLHEAFERVRPGERVALDDGAIRGTVRSNDGATIELVVEQAAAGGAKLRPDKGVNFPDTDLGLQAPTRQDLADLAAVADFADLVALSFVQSPQDIARLRDALAALGPARCGLVLKIETAAAFGALPRLLLDGLRTPPLGVMVARGDLAAEVGFERLSEVQEEILWLCEAARVPVVWATQVLEALATEGSPTRAEVSDAALGARAECVMLNKGPHIVDTVRFLADVLRRMEEHRDKGRTQSRRLSVSAL